MKKMTLIAISLGLLANNPAMAQSRVGETNKQYQQHNAKKSSGDSQASGKLSSSNKNLRNLQHELLRRHHRRSMGEKLRDTEDKIISNMK
jgi:hypothetical protein